MIISSTFRLIFITTENLSATNRLTKPNGGTISNHRRHPYLSLLSQILFSSLAHIYYNGPSTQSSLSSSRSTVRAALPTCSHALKKKKKILPTSERHTDAGEYTAHGLPSALFDLSSSAPSRFRRRGELRPHGPFAMCCEHLLR